MNNNFYSDINGCIYQYITTACYVKDEKKYVVYQELKPNFQYFIIGEDEFYNSFNKVDFEQETKGNNKQIESRALIKKEPDISLMAFLDAETIMEKINILNGLRGSMNESIITSIELSLDMPSGFSDLDTRIEAVKKTLQMHERYEGRRLRYTP